MSVSSYKEEQYKHKATVDDEKVIKAFGTKYNNALHLLL